MHHKPLWFWLVLWFLPIAANGQAAFPLTADRLQNGQSVELDKLNWKYLPGDLAGDDPQFADPQFDDRAWETLHGTAITLDSIPKSGWRGSGGLAAGDVVALMSDGLPERFNEQNAMLEDEVAKTFIAAHVHLSAQDFINGLAKLGNEWGGTRPQDDDVTFVVLKMK